MDLPAGAVASAMQWAALAAFASAIAFAVPGAWRSPELRAHRYPAALVATLVLWQVRAVTPDGPALHLLGAALLQLVFGWRLAVLGLAVVLAAHTLNGAGGWLAFGVNGLATVALPVAVAHAAARAAAARLPGNPFGYILGAGFGGGALSMAATVAASTGLLAAAGPADPARVLAGYGASALLLVFPEAFVTGAVTAWLAMFYPARLATWKPPWERRR